MRSVDDFEYGKDELDGVKPQPKPAVVSIEVCMEEDN